MSIHLDLEFRIVFTVVIALAAAVAGWRLVKALRAPRESPDRGDEGSPTA